MACRGPDATGYWKSGNGVVTLGHRRLAIIDLDAISNQPLHLHDADLSIVFNGEIYNYIELKRELESEGCTFTTRSDTEVILRLYERFGPSAIKRLRGMFAFVIWDGRDQSIFLARDPFGIKPLYYYDDGERLIVASQVRTVRALCNYVSPDPVGHLGFFLNGYVPDPHTMFNEIRSLPSGSWMHHKNGKSEISHFYSIHMIASQGAHQNVMKMDERERASLIVESLNSSIHAHLTADVEVGLFLSSGIDSAAIAWLAARDAGNRLKAITLGADLYLGKQEDEVPFARQIATTIGLDHEVRYLAANDFVAEMNHLISFMDQPSIDGVNTYFVSKLAAEAGLKVVLSGLGGDELFRGYPSFHDVPNIVNLNRLLSGIPKFGTAIRQLSAPIIKRLTSPKYASLFEFGASYSEAYFLRRALFMPWELNFNSGVNALNNAFGELSTEAFSDLDILDLPNESKIGVLELTRYMRDQLLRDSDWASMAWSLEIRVPFVDSVLMSELAPLLFNLRGVKKPEVLEAISHPLSSALVNRPKTGFSIPIREWMMGPNDGEQRGLRAWAKYVYINWCKRNNCPTLVTFT